MCGEMDKSAVQHCFWVYSLSAEAVYIHNFIYVCTQSRNGTLIHFLKNSLKVYILLEVVYCVAAKHHLAQSV